MTNSYELEEQTDNFIKFLALNKVDRFYPSALGKNLGISSLQALKFLEENSFLGKKIFLQWELRCPYCSRTLDIKDEKIANSEYFCNCGEEFEPQVTDFFPILKIDPRYKEYVLTNNKKKSSRFPVLNLQPVI